MKYTGALEKSPDIFLPVKCKDSAFPGLFMQSRFAINFCQAEEKEGTRCS